MSKIKQEGNKCSRILLLLRLISYSLKNCPQKFWQRCRREGKNRFSNLHNACWSQIRGLFITAPAGRPTRRALGHGEWWPRPSERGIPTEARGPGGHEPQGTRLSPPLHTTSSVHPSQLRELSLQRDERTSEKISEGEMLMRAE